MKKSNLRRLLAMCLCLTLVSVSLIGGTLAKYTTTVSGTTTATIASWNISSFDGETALNNNFTVALNNGNPIAPGDSGTFTITVKNTSDIDAQITAVTITGSDENKIKLVSDTNPAAESAVSLTKSTGTKDITFTWSCADVTESFEANTLSISITVEQRAAATSVVDEATAVTAAN